MTKKTYQIIGAASGFGAQIRACEQGPDTLKASGCLDQLKEKGIPCVGWETLYPTVRAQDQELPLKDALPTICALNNLLADRVFQAMSQKHFPVVIGGDHSIAVGTWNGVSKFLSQEDTKPLGLIWIDAHMDSHTPETTPSGAWHGMPLAALLGYGKTELAQLKQEKPILEPNHICLIGARSFEEGEIQLLKKLGVQIYFIDEVKKRGFDTVLKEAILIVSKDTFGYGVSLDIDVVDPSEAPGAGSLEPGGLSAKELLEGLTQLGRDPHFKAFELVEFNPERDSEGKTAALCLQILIAALSEGNPHE